jgi:cyclin L
MGALYLASKLEECPIRMRDLINVYDLLLSRARYELSSPRAPPSSSHTTKQQRIVPFRYTPMSYFSNTFYTLKESLVVAEMQILKRLGFNVQVQLPYGTMVNYLQVLGLVNQKGQGPDGEQISVPQMCWGYLNDACVSSISHHRNGLFHSNHPLVCKPPSTLSIRYQP